VTCTQCGAAAASVAASMAGTQRERATRAVRAYAPELLDAEIVELGRGLDNAVYAAGELVLRIGDGRSVGREARLLEAVASHVSIPIPKPRFVDEDAGVLSYELLPGQPLLGRSPPAGAAQRLGQFLRDLHAIDPATVAGVIPSEDAEPDAWLGGLDGPPDLVRILHATRPRPSPERVVAHADLGAEHILEIDGTLTGIIDWSDAAITDPALDLARLYRDFGPRFLEALLQVYGPLRHAMPRVKFFARCAALEDLAYGRATGRREYVANAQRSFAWLFP
jgi:aminoglycoside phosphotransferase (APT) family kinase protein